MGFCINTGHFRIAAGIVFALLLISSGTASAQQADGSSDATNRPVAQTDPAENPTEPEAENPESDAVPSEEEQRELGANENPMAVSEVKREIQREEDSDGKPERTTGIDIYGSARIRYRDLGDETGWQDGSSRMGVDADWRFAQESYLIGRYEWGFNLLTGLDPDTNIGELEDTVFTRLLYLGLDTPRTNLIVGKNWSPYYEVAAFTDRFQGAGGKGGGTYNAFTDGGDTGTGRADRAVQGKLRSTSCRTRYSSHST